MKHNYPRSNIRKKKTKKMLHILLDLGHAKKTPGKRSPKRENGDRFYEYLSNRRIGALVMAKLDALGIPYDLVLDPEVEEDKSLKARVATANEFCKKYGKENCLFISLHSNACGDGETWQDNARGWCIYTTKGVTKSDKAATMFYEEAEKLLPKYGMTTRKQMSDGDPDYEENFYVIYHTICPAVLLEQLFFTSRVDLNFLDSALGRDVLSDIVVNGIKRVIEEGL